MQNLVLYAFVVLITCMTPGPGVLCTLSSALRNGRPYALVAPTGNALGLLFTSIVSATGLGAVLTASASLYITVQTAGALVLFILGVRNWRAPVVDLARPLEQGARRNRKDTWSILSASFLLQTTNPMSIVFLLSLLPQFIHVADDYVPRVSLLIAIFVGTCWLVHIVYSFTAIYIRRYLKGESFSRILNRTSAILFWLMASSVFFSVVKKLF